MHQCLVDSNLARFLHDYCADIYAFFKQTKHCNHLWPKYKFITVVDMNMTHCMKKQWNEAVYESYSTEFTGTNDNSSGKIKNELKLN
jgi:hypothetical protein